MIRLLYYRESDRASGFRVEPDEGNQYSVMPCLDYGWSTVCRCSGQTGPVRRDAGRVVRGLSHGPGLVDEVRRVAQ